MVVLLVGSSGLPAGDTEERRAERVRTVASAEGNPWRELARAAAKRQHGRPDGVAGRLRLAAGVRNRRKKAAGRGGALPDGRSRGALLLTPAPAAERPQEFVLSNRSRASPFGEAR